MTNRCAKCGKPFPAEQDWCNWCDQDAGKVAPPKMDNIPSTEPNAPDSPPKPLGRGVWILLMGFLLGCLTLFLFAGAAFTGNVLFGYSAIAAAIYVLPIALILFIVGLAMSIVSPQRDTQSHQTIDVRSDVDK